MLCLVKVSNIEAMLRLNLNVMIVEKDFCYYQTLNVIKERSILISNLIWISIKGMIHQETSSVNRESRNLRGWSS